MNDGIADTPQSPPQPAVSGPASDPCICPRQQIILTAAGNAFAAYGYRKTSMDDIARGAAMSRPALYLHYRNKQDIFRTLAQVYFDQTADAVTKALAGSGSISDVLTTAFTAHGGEVFKLMFNSPHGMELLDATSATAEDIILAGEARLQDIYTGWLTRLEVTGQGHLAGSAQEVAGALMATLKGVKMSVTDYGVYQTRLGLLGAMIGAGLTGQ